jgi:hypothetical protein
MNKQVNIPVSPQVLTPQSDESPAKTILANLKLKLEETPGLNHIDEDWGQLDDYSPNFPVQWPCALIDITAANYTNLGQDWQRKPQNRQQAEMMLTVTVANLKLTNTSRHAGNIQHDAAAHIFDLVQFVHEQLHGFSPHPQAGKMIRQSMQRVKRDDGVQQYEIVYGFELYNV